MKHKILVIVVSAALLLGVLSLTAGAFEVSPAVGYLSEFAQAFTVNTRIIDTLDDAYLYQASYPIDVIFRVTDESNGADEQFFQGGFDSDVGVYCQFVDSPRTDDIVPAHDGYFYDITIEYTNSDLAFNGVDFAFQPYVVGATSANVTNVQRWRELELRSPVFGSTSSVTLEYEYYGPNGVYDAGSATWAYGYSVDVPYPNGGTVTVPYFDGDACRIGFYFSQVLQQVYDTYGAGVIMFGMSLNERIRDDFFTIADICVDLPLNVNSYAGWLTQIYDDARQGAYDEGYDAGETHGWYLGYNRGLEEGYDEGYNAGQSNAIFQDGVGGFLSDSVGGFIDAPIFGDISIGDLLLTVCGVGLFILFLKFFAGG